jgi:tetratricopeptide (TPR) repeat protein
MKKVLLKLTLPVAIVLLFVAQSFSQGVPPYQNPKYGVDSASRMKCAMNISLYSEFYKQKNYKDAVKPWRTVFSDAPKASKNTYKRGATIYKNLIIKEKNHTRKEEMIDTLMLIYDRRIEYFGDKGLVLSYKGVDLYTFRKDTEKQQVYDILTEAITLEGKKSKSAVITVYMQVVVALYKEGKIDGEKVINGYTFCMETLDKTTEYNKALVAKGGKYKKRGEKELKKIETSSENVEALFSESGAANCEALVKIFGAKCQENKDNIEWLKKVNKLLKNTDCTDSDLFAKSAERQYALEPSADAAHNLARLFLKREEYAKAEKYYEEATKLQEDKIKKSLYYYEWSQLAFAMKNYPKVRTLSNKAISNNPDDGKPYLTIGKAYAASQKMKIGKETVEHSTVYWVAVDAFKKAKMVDPSLKEEADNLIATYSKYFPKYEEWFMAIGTKEGDSYTVGGWINVTTKVRFK